jgi:hypothetical protein
MRIGETRPVATSLHRAGESSAGRAANPMLAGMASVPDTREELVPVAVSETPEEYRLRMRVERLRGEVADAAAELEELRATLGAFEARYEAQVGVLIVKLDRVNIEIAKLTRKIDAAKDVTVSMADVEEAIEQEFAAEQARIDEEYRESAGTGRRAATLPDAPPPDVARAIKEQYRKLARRFHPDMAITEAQRTQNEIAMKRINEAMEANDLDLLGMLEATLPTRTDDMPKGTSRARIHWASGEIARLERVLTTTIGRLAAVKSSSIYELWERSERHPQTFDRLAREISDEIIVARMQLRALLGDFERLSASRARATGDHGASV